MRPFVEPSPFEKKPTAPKKSEAEMVGEFMGEKAKREFERWFGKGKKEEIAPGQASPKEVMSKSERMIDLLEAKAATAYKKAKGAMFFMEDGEPNNAGLVALYNNRMEVGDLKEAKTLADQMSDEIAKVGCYSDLAIASAIAKEDPEPFMEEFSWSLKVKSTSARIVIDYLAGKPYKETLAGLASDIEKEQVNFRDQSLRTLALPLAKVGLMEEAQSMAEKIRGAQMRSSVETELIAAIAKTNLSEAMRRYEAIPMKDLNAFAPVFAQVESVQTGDVERVKKLADMYGKQVLRFDYPATTVADVARLKVLLGLESSEELKHAEVIINETEDSTASFGSAHLAAAFAVAGKDPRAAIRDAEAYGMRYPKTRVLLELSEQLTSAAKQIKARPSLLDGAKTGV